LANSLGYESLVALELGEQRVGDGISGDLHLHVDGDVQPGSLALHVPDVDAALMME
jgi:hypothetical protein